MDVFVTRDEQVFVWDSEKAASNARKHGVTFEAAVAVFFDPYVRYADASVEGEYRLAAIGTERTGSVLLYVVHLERGDEAIRLISARAAEGWERRLYEDIA